MKETLLLFFICFVLGNRSLAQVTIDSSQFSADTMITVKTDAASVKKDSIALLHSPRKATLLSVAVPGLGQAYNKKYWKIPVIYGLAGLMTYFIVDNNKQYTIYKTAYSVRLDGDPATIDKFEGTYRDEDLKTLKDYYRRNRDLSIIALGMTYILNIVDAAVDAHLYYFDVSDDLSMKIQPAVNHMPNNYYAGLNIRLIIR